MEENTKTGFNFFRSVKGKYFLKDKPDTVISQGVRKLFARVIGALLKSGVAFL